MDAITLHRAYRAQERVETLRDDIEAELGRFEVAVDEDAQCVLSTEAGAQFVARLSGPEADARLTIEELPVLDALALCNCCDVNPSNPRSRAGYCSECETSARNGEPCWHDEEVEA